MIPAERCMHVFGHAMAAYALYGPGHQARSEASSRLYRMLEELLAVDRRLSFSFLDDAVIYGALPVHGLRGWVWGRRLGVNGIRRLEFTAAMTPGALDEFLAVLHRRLSAEPTDEALPRWPGIEAGDVTLSTANGEPASPEPRFDAVVLSLKDELDAVRHAYERVALGSDLPLADVDAVVRALTVSLHSEGELLMPLLSLRSLDDHAALHAVNTAVLSMTFCEWLGLAGGDIRAVGKAALLHDIGMARVPREVFQLKRMSQAVRSEVARHPAEGARLLVSRSARLDLAATVAYEHHFRMDGEGYPVRRFHRDLHYVTRIISICGTYDALRSERSYRPARDGVAALGEIQRGAGAAYDSGVAQAFIQMMRRWEHRLVPATAH
jgi:HD-GYP domain-containing protein (c-di-GMP phosphodiesterase class II)